MSTSNALSKRPSSDESALMPPPPAPKRIKRPAQALEEEEYDDAISDIIKRDFFPGLAETDSQKEYLAALQSDDPAWIAEAGQKLRAVSTPGPEGRKPRAKQGRDGAGDFTPLSGLYATAGDTPRGGKGETPVPDGGGVAEAQRDGKKVDTDMSLADFQARYTSEDNESFYRLVDRSNKKRGEKHAWLWANNKIPTARQIEWHAREQKAITQKAEEAAQNGGKELISVEYTDKRKAAPDAWKAKPNNNFMFAPDSVEDSLETVQQRAEANSRMGPKEIVYENTRMPPPPRKAQTVPASPSLSAVRDAIAGRPRLSGSELGSSDAGGGGGETPRVNGYAFVDSEEPEPEPEDDPRYSTDGPIDLGPGDSTPNPFSIRETRGREALHHRMVDKLNVKKAEKQRDVTKTPLSGRYGGSKTPHGGLTPAAQRLLGQVGGTPKTKSSLGDGWGSTPRSSSKPGLAGVTPVRRK